MIESKAVVTDGRGHVALADIHVPRPVKTEVLVRIRVAGLCRTDADAMAWGQPAILGHEGAGVVEAVGGGVVDVAPGDRVILNWAIPCGACAQCLRGAPYLCACQAEFCGEPPNAPSRPRPSVYRGAPISRVLELGSLSEYALVDAAAITPLPEAVGFGVGAIAGCSVMTGAGSVFNVAEVQPGASVVVVGCGAVGLNAIQAARVSAASPIIAVDRDEQALAKAAALGADFTVLARAEDQTLSEVQTQVRHLTGGEGADHVLEAAGSGGRAFQAMRLARPGGKVTLMSGFDRGEEIQVSGDLFLWNKRLEVSLYGGCLPARDFPRLFSLYMSGQLKLDEQIERVIPLDAAPAALEEMALGRAPKTIVEVSN